MSAVRPTRWFRGEPLGTRAHVALRWATGPFAGVAALLPATGSLLDWGAGHGLLGLVWAGDGSERRVRNVDIDSAKVAAARAAVAAAGLAERIETVLVGDDALPEGSWDAVVLDDVLYLLAPEGQERLARAAARALAPGGRVVCKEMARSPRWKHRLADAQERVTVGRLGISASAGGVQPFPDPADVAGWLRAEGLDVTSVPLDHRHHVPHVAIVGERPRSADAAAEPGRLHL